MDDKYNFPPESDYELIEIMACTNKWGGHRCNNRIDCHLEPRMIRVLKTRD